MAVAFLCNPQHKEGNSAPRTNGRRACKERTQQIAELEEAGAAAFYPTATAAFTASWTNFVAVTFSPSCGDIGGQQPASPASASCDTVRLGQFSGQICINFFKKRILKPFLYYSFTFYTKLHHAD